MFDVIVVGSGPAGVSAAWPLVEAGWRVAMIDAGNGTAPTPPSGDVSRLRRDRDQWRVVLGSDFSALDAGAAAASPKLRVPAFRSVFAGYTDAYRLECDDFLVVGSLASGGLSNAWGAGVACYDPAEVGLPEVADDLANSYKRIAERIGISGSDNDDLARFFGCEIPLQAPIKFGPNAAFLLGNYERRREAVKRAGLTLGRARNAVLSIQHRGRAACDSSGMCLYGCANGAIYNAFADLGVLRRNANFTYFGDTTVEQLSPIADGIELKATKAGGQFSMSCSRVLLACGTIGTGILVLQALAAKVSKSRLLTSPAAVFALLLPGRMGAAEVQSFGLSHLSFQLHLPNEYAFGNLFETSGLPLSDFVRRIPMSRIGAIKVMRGMMPSMLVGNCYLSSRFSKHSLEIAPDRRAVIKGAWRDDLGSVISQTRRGLAKAARQCGAWMLPGSFQLGPIGADVHYAGTVPMSVAPQFGQANLSGAVIGLPGLYVVDGAALPSLPPKPPTFTVMANADRIARGLLQAKMAAA